jgi:hypothetical protein
LEVFDATGLAENGSELDDAMNMSHLGGGRIRRQHLVEKLRSLDTSATPAL